MIPRIVLPLPPSVNKCYQRTPNGMALTPKAREWKELAAWEAKISLRGWPVAEEKVILDIWVYWADRRRRDSDNLLKLLQDALKGIVYVDDLWALPRIQDWQVDNQKPRVEIIPKLKKDDVDLC